MGNDKGRFWMLWDQGVRLVAAYSALVATLLATCGPDVGSLVRDRGAGLGVLHRLRGEPLRRADVRRRGPPAPGDSRDRGRVGGLRNRQSDAPADECRGGPSWSRLRWPSP